MRLAMLLILVGGGYGIYFYFTTFGSSARVNNDIPTAIARTTTLLDKVVEQGVLESQSTVTGNCEIDDHENKIIFLAKEGMLVKKDEVCLLYTSPSPRDATLSRMPSSA